MLFQNKAERIVHIIYFKKPDCPENMAAKLTLTLCTDVSSYSVTQSTVFMPDTSIHRLSKHCIERNSLKYQKRENERNKESK